MKTLSIIFALAVSLTATAQLQFNKESYGMISLVVDPVASVKDNGLNIGLEIELVNTWHYVRASSQSFTVLRGGYTDLIMTNGINLTYGIFKPTRFYAGFRSGVIFRAQNVYPTVGIEAGITQPITKKIAIGVRATYDLREDMKAFHWPVIWRESGYIIISYRL